MLVLLQQTKQTGEKGHFNMGTSRERRAMQPEVQRKAKEANLPLGNSRHSYGSFDARIARQLLRITDLRSVFSAAR